MNEHLLFQNQEEPWCRLKSDAAYRHGNDRFEGFSVDFMDEISRLNHFSYQLYIVHDGQFGAMLENGEWNGIVGEIKSGVRKPTKIQTVELYIHTVEHDYNYIFS